MYELYPLQVKFKKGAVQKMSKLIYVYENNGPFS